MHFFFIASFFCNNKNFKLCKKLYRRHRHRCCWFIMELSLNRIIFIILFFIVQIFHVCFVDARYPFIAAQVLNYTFIEDKNNNLTKIAIDSCASLTWIPLGKNDGNDCKTLKMDFLSDAVQEDELNLLEYCKSLPFPSYSNFTFNGTVFDMRTLHDKVASCGKGTICEDIKDEIVIEEIWKKLKSPRDPGTVHSAYKSEENARNSTKPFSSRMDIQHYIFQNVRNNKAKVWSSDKDKECVDRYGRKYPLPDELGGCVMFQHKNPLTNKTEFFMPMEKRDLVERLSMYPAEHYIRNDSAILSRLLPGKMADNEDHNCLTLFIEDGLQMFVHCVYSRSDSWMFKATDYEAYFCPKEGEINHTYPQGDSSYMYVDAANIVNETRKIDSSNFGFSKNCYISTKFSPKSVSNGIEVSLELKTIGSETSCSNFTLNANASSDEYAKTINESMMEYCPWDDQNSATVCFQVESKNLFVHYAHILDIVKTPILFDNCFFQNPTTSNKCYYEVDTKNVPKILRFPPKFIPKLEKNELVSTDDAWSTTKEKEQHCGYVYLTNEDKQQCYAKLLAMDEFPTKDGTHDYLRDEYKDYNKSGKALICNCDSSPECDIRGIVNKALLDDHRHDLMCNSGNTIDDHSVINGTVQQVHSDFFCIVKLTQVPEGQKMIKKYEFKAYDLPNGTDPNDCLTSSQFSKSFNAASSKGVDLAKTCWKDTEIANVFHCCCRTSKEPCNTPQIVDHFSYLLSDDARKAQQRINFGCYFGSHVTKIDNTTCAKSEVRHNVLMRCYGVFKFTNAKPEVVKESCYWPHPQYHDEYSIFCSKTFMDDMDFAENNCFNTFINDYTHLKETKEFDRTLILCCNAGYYPEAREKMLTHKVKIL